MKKPATQPSARRYFKEVRFRQIRALVELSRRGSFASTATSLGLAVPSVWQQVRALESQPAFNELRQTLLDCQADEVAHRDEAAASRGPDRSSVLLQAWCAMVGAGSKAAVALIRFI